MIKNILNRADIKYIRLGISPRLKASNVLILFTLHFLLYTNYASAQVTSEIDTTKIRIGEQINYKINVETDSTALVVFPEGQTFMPLESVEALKIDTTKRDSKFLLSRIYKLTQFDSGVYTIPRQKIIIGDKPFFTDSLKIAVNTIEVDTLKQQLYDIKPIIEVKKSGSNWWKWLLGILAAVALVAFLLYWFIWRTKPLTEEEKVALLPPYDRAKLALQKLDESQYLIRAEVKEYYSELTFIIRKYLDEKVYDRALESTTSELIDRLNLLKDGNQVDLSKDTIKNIESILQRADLVKFAKSAPDTALAEMDKTTIDKAIDHVKVSLPEPSEEEKLLDQKYKEEQERKKKRRKIWLTVAISLFLLVATFIGFGLKYGFGYVKDTIIGHESKELLEGDWVESAYGYPPIWLETPKVLRREETIIKDSLGQDKESKFDAFYYGSMIDDYYLLIRSVPVQPESLVQYFAQIPGIDMNAFQNMSEEQFNEFVLNHFAQQYIGAFEEAGAENIVLLNKEYTNELDGTEGLKSYGSLTGTNKLSGIKSNFEFEIYSFFENDAIHLIVFMYKKDDVYAPKITERVLKSVRLKPEETEEEKE